MTEERLVAWLTRRAGGHLGDDTAALPRLRGTPVVTVDQQIESVHFPSGLDAAVIARRLLAVNLSDLAASGAAPRFAFLALAAPASFDRARFFTAFLSAARQFGVALQGGDLARSESVHLSLTLIGEKRLKDASLARDRARPGHRIWLGGTVGESALGQRLVELGARPRGSSIDLPALFSDKVSKLAAIRAVRRHLEPSPQLELGLWLAALGPRRAGAAIDVSDGFAKDLHRICAASGVGAQIQSAALAGATPPLFAGLCGALNEDPAAMAQAGGEDYVLLFTLPARVAPPGRFGCTAVGVVTRGSAVVLVDSDGGSSPLGPGGWDHLAS